MTDRFFEFGNNTIHNSQFTWAVKILPRSEMVHRTCSGCGSVQNYPSGTFDVIVEGGLEYPDVLGCGAYPFLIVSKAVVTAWYDAGISSFHTYPVGIAEVKPRELHNLMPPCYFRVEIDGRCQIDLTASRVKVIRICPECRRVIARPRLSSERSYHMVESSWDGSQLFRDLARYPQVHFCTQLVLDLARRYSFTNFRFESMEGPFDPASMGIDYLKA